MRGEISPQDAMFSYVSPERRATGDHPLRRIKADADQALRAMSGELDELYASTGRPSIASERLLKGQLLPRVNQGDSSATIKMRDLAGVWG